MLCSVAQAKQILRLSDTTHDSDLALFLPYAQDDLIEYLNNCFPDTLITYEAGTLAFVKGNTDTITDSDSDFVVQGFTAGMDIVVEGAHANDGIYELSAVVAGTLTLTSVNELVDMDPDDAEHPLGSVRISMVAWPKPLRLVVAKMAYWLIQLRGARPDDVSAKIMDGTTLEYAGSSAYPKRILTQANKWKRVGFV